VTAAHDVPELHGLSEAEDFFEALGVAADPAILSAHRLRVMKRFGMSLAALVAEGLPADPAARRIALAQALREAHELVSRNVAREGLLGGTRAPPLVQLGTPRRSSA
jgi:hypothetical protein